MYRFITRVWNLVLAGRPAPEGPPSAQQVADLRRITHKTIRRATDDMEAFKFNTLLAALMEYTNYLVKAKDTEVYGSEAWNEALRTIILLLAPMAPHVTEEL